MNIKGMSRAQLFLIELIIVILFFTLASVIALQVFVKASDQAEHTKALNGSLMAVQNAAERDKIKTYDELNLNGLTVYYNDMWQKTDDAKAKYILTSRVDLEERWTGVMANYTYTIKNENEVIYQLKSKKYYSGEMISQDENKEGVADE